MKKKLSKISLLLSSIALFFGLLVGIKPSSVTPVSAASTITTRCGVEAEWSQWFSSSELPSGGYYYLETDVVLTKSYLSKLSATFLDLNGKTITYEGEDFNSAIFINGEFNLYDSVGGGKITKGSKTSIDRCVCISKLGELNMYGGTITGFTSSENGSGVVIYSGCSFNMYGGSIENCISEKDGAGIFAQANASFNMYGGFIGNCISNGNGGGIFLSVNSSFNMYGGTIGTNTAKDGSGIYANSASCNFSGGRLNTNNTYEGVSLDSTSTITFDPNGGTGGIETLEATWGENLNSGNQISVPTREGYTFLGYFDSKVGGDRYFNPIGKVEERAGDGKKWDYIGPVTLYAHWTNPVEIFSEDFIVLTNGFCVHEVDEIIQDDLKGLFDDLSEDNQTIFKNTVPQIPYVDSDIVVNAKSRYCYMISERGYDDFLEIFTEDELKALKSRGTSLSFFSDSPESSSTILVISLIIIGFITLSGYVVLKKENRQ